jgi:broad specificity phosphatase PhoE
MMSKVKTIYAFRHGETDWNKESRFQGRMDIPLNETGRQQALRLREFLHTTSIEAVVSSDLSRALETAQIAMGEMDVPLILDPRLRETNLGEAEGLTYEEVITRFGSHVMDAWRSIGPGQGDVRFPGGESKQEHLTRILAALDEVLTRQPFDHFAVSTHGGALRRLIHHLRPDLTEPVMIGNCVLYEIRFHVSHGSWEVDLEPRCIPS